MADIDYLSRHAGALEEADADRDLSRAGERVRIKLGAEPVGVIRYEQAGLIFVALDDPRFGDATAGYRAADLADA